MIFQDFFRSGPEEVEEKEIYAGSQNTLRMFQKYTHEFFCSFDLNNYPFDRQVGKRKFLFP